MTSLKHKPLFQCFLALSVNLLASASYLNLRAAEQPGIITNLTLLVATGAMLVAMVGFSKHITGNRFNQ